MNDKAQAIDQLKNSGTLYGATILGTGVRHNEFGNKLMAIYNKKKIFSNEGDSLTGLTRALQQHFGDVKTECHGTVALFRARNKI